MPIFDLVCKNCGKEYEDQRFSFDEEKKLGKEEPIELTCECGNKIFKKQLSVPGKHSSWAKW